MKLNEILTESDSEFHYPRNKIELDNATRSVGLLQSNYSVNDDFSINIKNNITFEGLHITRLPFKINSIDGNLYFHDCRSLVSLEGCPEKVTQYFTVIGCDSLTSLRGAPSSVRHIVLSGCGKLESLECLPSVIGTSLELSQLNGIRNLHGIENTECINLKIFDCDSLVSLDGANGIHIKNITITNCNALNTLSGCPPMLGHLTIEDCESLISLRGCPIAITGQLYVGTCNKLRLAGISDFITTCDSIVCQEYMKPNIELVLVGALRKIKVFDTSGNTEIKQPYDIIKKYFGRPEDIFECQAELIDAGFAEYAQL